MTTNNTPETYIHDAITQITSDTQQITLGGQPLYQATKAHNLESFAYALTTIALSQRNLELDPALAEDEDYMRMVRSGYSLHISSYSDLLEVDTRIHVADRKTRKEIAVRSQKVKHMQVTGYDPKTQTHELTFTLKDGTTRTATAIYTTYREIAILENLRLTETTLHPYSNFATRKIRGKNALDLHIGTRIH